MGMCLTLCPPTNLISCSTKSHFMLHQSHFMLHQSHFMIELTLFRFDIDRSESLAE